jgi:hypothetical protein
MSLQATRKLARKIFNRIYDGTSHPSFAARDALLMAAAELNLDHHGDEGFVLDNSTAHTKGITYLNMGDSYTPTVYVRTSRTDVRFCVGTIASLAGD